MAVRAIKFYRALLIPILFFVMAASASGQAAATNSRIETGQISDKSVAAVLPYQILLPSDYHKSDKRYPVLYLLHGLRGHYSDWLSKTNLARYAEKYSLIIVTPEGNNSWYTNSVSDPKQKYEDYIIKDLIPEIDGRYRTIADRHGRAIAGLSMGGYGAIKLGLKFRSLFAFVGSLSGALKAARWTEQDLKNFPFVIESLKTVFGSQEDPSRAANDPYELIKGAKSPMPYFYLDCGTSDALLGNAREFTALLAEQKIAYEYRELPGEHNWAYWDKQIQTLLEVLEPILKIE
jgi:putative tributyrin esterase